MKLNVSLVIPIAVLLIATGLAVGEAVDTSESASQKLDQIWKLVTKTPTSLNWYSPLLLLSLLVKRMNFSFDYSSDVLPEGRKKIIHTQGQIARMKWVPTPQAYEWGYSGLFQNKTKNCLIRLSIAKPPPIDHGPSNGKPFFVPGVSVKCFRDSISSTNWFAMYSLDGQASWNFFANSLSNHVKNPQEVALKVLLNVAFRRASKWPTKVGLSDFARYDDAGHEIAHPKFPYQLILVPNPAITARIQQIETTLTGAIWLKQFNQIDAGEWLYRVDALPEPSTLESDRIHIADIYADSKFTPSLFGDERLYFQHVRMENDMALRQDWAEYLQSQSFSWARRLFGRAH